MINTIGGVVSPAEKLISIVPKDSPLIVKVNVLNQDIGFVKNDMNSKIKIDTFSFQKYGFFEVGMSVTAEIKVGKRRVIEFFIYPIIQYLDEGLSVR